MSVKHCRLRSETVSLEQHVDFQISPGIEDSILPLPLCAAAPARHPRALGGGQPRPQPGRSSAQPAPSPDDPDVRWYSVLHLLGQAKT